MAVAITVSGLRGGHSGLDIQRNRGNAIRLLSRTLLRLQRDGDDVFAWVRDEERARALYI